MAEVKEEIKGIVRVAGRDIDGHLPLERALTHIRGISYMMANAILTVFSETSGVSRNTKLGELTEEQVEKLEDIIYNPLKYGIPEYMLNNRFELFSGETRHLVETDIDLYKREIVNYHQSMKSWKGIRYSLGLPVRGQRTKTSFRRGRTVGVQRKKR